jgi:cephalosporin hydroxylase
MSLKKLIYKAIIPFVGRRFNPLQKRYRKSFRMTLADWLVYHQENIVFEKSSWMGIPTQKNPCDMWIYQEIMAQVKPTLIIEIGSRYGGSALYFAHLMDLLGQGRVLSIDIDHDQFRAQHPRITKITGQSNSPEIIRQAAEMAKGEKVLVIHDGDHFRDPVFQDLKSYAPLVSVGSYLIVEDSIMDIFDKREGIAAREDGPFHAIEDFLELNPGFVSDTSRERYIITYAPHGFLKRVS